MAKVSWLHISDTHILRKTETEHAEAASQEKVLNQFTDFMQNRFPKDQIERPKLIVVTGDLGFQGLKDDYSSSDKHSVKRLIDGLAKTLDIPESEYYLSVFPVPGNHDADRSELGKTPFNKMILDIAEDPEQLDQFFLDPDDRKRPDVLHRFQAYCDFVRRLWGEDKLSNEDVLCYTKRIPVGDSGQHVSVVGLNTAWLCHSQWLVSKMGPKESEDTAHLRLCAPIVERLLKEIPEGDITVALMHHDYDITADRTSGIGELLESHCDFILCGHEHRETWAKPTLKRAHKVRAGHLYDRRGRRNAVNIVEVEPETGQVKMVTVHYRTDRGGFWCVDRDYDPTQGNESGGHYFDSYTGLLRFALHGKELLSPKPRGRDAGRKWQSGIEELRKRLASDDTKRRFDGCLSRQEVLYDLHKLGVTARAAKSFAKQTNDDVQLRNEAIINLCDYAENTMALRSEKNRETWRCNLDEIANAEKSGHAEDIVETAVYLEPLMKALVVVIAYNTSPEFDSNAQLPTNMFNALLRICQNTERIVDLLTQVQKDGMQNAHGGVVKRVTDIGLPPPFSLPIVITGLNGGTRPDGSGRNQDKIVKEGRKTKKSTKRAKSKEKSPGETRIKDIEKKKPGGKSSRDTAKSREDL